MATQEQIQKAKLQNEHLDAMQATSGQRAVQDICIQIEQMITRMYDLEESLLLFSTKGDEECREKMANILVFKQLAKGQATVDFFDKLVLLIRTLEEKVIESEGMVKCFGTEIGSSVLKQFAFQVPIIELNEIKEFNMGYYMLEYVQLMEKDPATYLDARMIPWISNILESIFIHFLRCVATLTLMIEGDYRDLFAVILKEVNKLERKLPTRYITADVTKTGDKREVSAIMASAMEGMLEVVPTSMTTPSEWEAVVKSSTLKNMVKPIVGQLATYIENPNMFKGLETGDGLDKQKMFNMVCSAMGGGVKQAPGNVDLFQKTS